MSQGRSRNDNRRGRDDAKKTPWGDAYHVEQQSEDRSNWIKLGAVWLHEDKEGFDFTLDAEPTAWRDPKVAKRIVIRKRVKREDDR